MALIIVRSSSSDVGSARVALGFFMAYVLRGGVVLLC